METNRLRSRSFIMICVIILIAITPTACRVKFNQPNFTPYTSTSPVNMENAIHQTVVAVEGSQEGINDGTEPIVPANQETAIHLTVVAIEGTQPNADGSTSSDLDQQSIPGAATTQPQALPPNSGSPTTAIPPAVLTTPVPPSQNNNPPNNNQPNQNSNVTVFNHSSRPIVSMVIDGAEQINSEADSILSGGSAGLVVPDGTHSFVAHNGWWEGGFRQTLYRWSISFSAQDKTIEVYDHPISSLLTKYQQSGYLAGEFYSGNPVQYYYAGFCFKNSGTFTFYVDGQANDSGSYTEVSRNPSGFTVTFNVGNAAGESFNGIYNELNDSFTMQNGPADWPVITYVRQSGCP